MIVWLFTPLGKLASAAAILAALYGLWQWDRHNQFEAGRGTERIAAEKRAEGLNKQREKDLEELGKMPVDRLRCELRGGMFTNGKCN